MLKKTELFIPYYHDASERVRLGKGSYLDKLVAYDEPSDVQGCRITVEEWRQIVTNVLLEAGETVAKGMEHDLQELQTKLIRIEREAAWWNTAAIFLLIILIVFMVAVAVVERW